MGGHWLVLTISNVNFPARVSQTRKNGREYMVFL